MTQKEYNEFKKLLYNPGKCDMNDVVDDYSPEARKQRLLMKAKIIDFEKKYNSAHAYLVKSGRD